MIVISFALGLTVLRQTRAIWHMHSPNAVTFNTTLNTVTAIEPMLVVTIIILLILAALICIPRGFG